MRSPLLFNIILKVLAAAIRQEEIKGILTGKEEVKLSLFTDNVMLYTIGSTEKLLDLINESPVVGYKINTQKLIAFLYTNDELPESETKKTILFPISTTLTRRYLGINLTKEVKDLYSENYRTLKKEIEEDANK